MAFDPVVVAPPASIGDISVVLTDYASEDTTATARYEVQVRDADGGMVSLKQGDLVPHLTAAQISGLMALMANLREKAQALLPNG